MAGRAAIAAAFVLLGGAAAQASEATTIADRAGFLVGHAMRCGVAAIRVDRSAALVSKLISAYAEDDGDRDAAIAQFTDRLLASMIGGALGDPVPSCGAIRGQLATLEAHRPQDQAMAHDDGSTGKRPQPPTQGSTADAKPAISARPAATRGEALTADRRTALELRSRARAARRHPPSI